MRLIRRDASGARVVPDTFRILADDEEVPELGDVIVSLARWHDGQDGLRGRHGRTGLVVPGDADPSAVAPLLAGVELLAIELPKFSDGRAYSLARLLRERHGYAGELRAVGNVLRDQLLYLARCGFDSFVLSPGKDPFDALGAFDDFSGAYQPAAPSRP